jgi:hypothetical protein
MTDFISFSSREEQGPFSSFPLEVRLQGSTSRILCGSGYLMSGDLLYSLQSTPQSPRGLYTVFRPSCKHTAVVGMLINRPDTAGVTYWTKMKLCEKKAKLIEKITLRGVLKCSRNISAKSSQDRVLYHVSRLALVLFWPIDTREVDYIWNNRQELSHKSFTANLPCCCRKREIPAAGLNSTLLNHKTSALRYYRLSISGRIKVLRQQQSHILRALPEPNCRKSNIKSMNAHDSTLVLWISAVTGGRSCRTLRETGTYSSQGNSFQKAKST